MPVAVKTQGIARAKQLIGKFLHENYPKLYTSAHDWIEGGIELNFEVSQNCAETIRMDPHDIPYDIVLPTGSWSGAPDLTQTPATTTASLDSYPTRHSGETLPKSPPAPCGLTGTPSCTTKVQTTPTAYSDALGAPK